MRMLTYHWAVHDANSRRNDARRPASVLFASRVSTRLFACIALAIASVASIGCGGGGAATAPEAAAPAAKPRNADTIAIAVANGKTSVLLHSGRVRNNPLAAKVLAVGRVARMLEGSGIDPLRDVERAFVTAPDVTHPGGTIAVLEHDLTAERLRATLDGLVEKSAPDGAWLDDLGVPAARVRMRGETRVVAEVSDQVLVILPEPLARQATRFVGTGGLPEPIGDEAAVAIADDPSHTLAAPRVPPIPATLKQARATVRLTPDGGAEVDVDATSLDEAQAATDAAELTATMERISSVRIAILTVRLFDPIPFSASGDHVKAHASISATDLDRLLGVAAAFAPE
jgi:hypothetical protein